MEHSRPRHVRRFSEFTSDIELSEFIKYYSDVKPAVINIVLHFCKNISGVLLRSSLASTEPESEYWFLCKFGHHQTGSNRIEQEYSRLIMFNFGQAGLVELVKFRTATWLRVLEGLCHSQIVLDWLQLRCVQCNCDYQIMLACVSLWWWWFVFQRLARV